ncbi:MAG: insulinase family protein [Chloroflexi bacterium]|nr:insulinase family protein [Chloroflexota bacterium]
MFQKTVLDNGLRILTATVPHVHSVTVGVFIGAGSRYEPDERGGAFHFIEHLCFKGTSRRPNPKELSEAIEGVGGMMNGSTEREITSYWVKVARPHFELAQDLLIDMLRNSLFETQALERERQVILEELSMTNDHPDSRVELLIDQVVWPNHPLGRDTGGTPESVRGLSREALLEYEQKQYVAPNIVFCVVGNIDHSEVVETMAPLLRDWPTGLSLSWLPVVDGQRELRVQVEFRKSDQTHLALAVPGLSAFHPDRYALDLLSIILGEGMSSRLFLELREQRGLVYEVHSGVTHFKDCGALTIFAAVDPKNAPEALEVTLQELAKMREGMPEREMEKAKELAQGRLLLRMEDTRSMVYWGGSRSCSAARSRTSSRWLRRSEVSRRRMCSGWRGSSSGKTG